MTDSESRVTEAIGATRRGWVLISLRGKVPVENDWPTFDLQTEPTATRIAGAGNIGLVTGKRSGIIVIDEDTPGAADDFFDGSIPYTPTVLTGGGGRHFYFRAPDDCPGNRARVGGLGIDVRGEGGQVVFIGSIHPDTGKPYRWAPDLSIDDVDPAELPAAALAKLAKRQAAPAPMAERAAGDRYGVSGMAREVEKLLATPEGARNDALNRAAFACGQLVGGGYLERVDAELELQSAGLAIGLPQGEVDRTISASLDAGERDPRIPRPMRAASTFSHDRGAAAEVVCPVEPSRFYSVDEARADFAAPRAGVEPEPWGEPVPFGEVSCPVEFPTGGLPVWLGEWVDAVSRSTQTPVCLAGCVALAVISSTIAKKIVIRTGLGGWVEPVQLWTLAIMPPASRKTAVFTRAIAPLESYEIEEQDRLGPSADEHDAEANRLVMRIKSAEQSQSRCLDPAKCEQWGDVAREAQSRLDLLGEPERPPQLFASEDTTPEALVGLMLKNDGRIAVLAAEAGELFAIAGGRYGSGGVNLGSMLKGHTGETIKVARQTRENQSVRSPALTFAGTMQPDVLRELQSKPEFRRRGYLGRMLFAIPPSNIGHRETDVPGVPDAITEAYAARLRGLIDLPVREHPTPVEFDSDALAVLKAYDAEFEPELLAGGRWGGLTDWAGKAVGATIRIAATLHAASVGPDELIRQPISKATLLSAIGYVSAFFGPHAEVALARTVDRRLDDAVLEALGEIGKPTTTLREVHRKMSHETTDDLRRSLSDIEERGWIRTSTGDRRSIEIEVHPRLVAMSTQGVTGGVE